jgi:hypothetical protein
MIIAASLALACLFWWAMAGGETDYSGYAQPVAFTQKLLSADMRSALGVGHFTRGGYFFVTVALFLYGLCFGFVAAVTLPRGGFGPLVNGVAGIMLAVVAETHYLPLAKEHLWPQAFQIVAAICTLAAFVALAALSAIKAIILGFLFGDSARAEAARASRRRSEIAQTARIQSIVLRDRG